MSSFLRRHSASEPDRTTRVDKFVKTRPSVVDRSPTLATSVPARPPLHSPALYRHASVIAAASGKCPSRDNVSYGSRRRITQLATAVCRLPVNTQRRRFICFEQKLMHRHSLRPHTL